MVTVPVTRCEDCGQLSVLGGGVQPKIDEPRAGDARRCYPGGVEVGGVQQLLREIPRLSAEWLRQEHGGVRRPVSKRRVPRTLEHRLEGLGGTEFAGGVSEYTCNPQFRTQFVSRGHLSLPPDEEPPEDAPPPGDEPPFDAFPGAAAEVLPEAFPLPEESPPDAG